MEKYLIALDLDGTLLNDFELIENRTREVIKEISSLGHYIVLSTGRPFRRTKKYYDELDLKTPVINHHGAIVYNGKFRDCELERYRYFPKKVVEKIVKYCTSFGVQNIILEFSKERITSMNDNFEFRDNFFKVQDISFQKNLDVLEDPINIIIYPQAHNYELLRESISSDIEGASNIIQWGSPWNLIEIINSEVNKATSLEHIRSKLHVQENNTIAIGDADNDIEMIRYANMGVAMGNASSSVKKVADYITEDNNSNGIAVFLEEFFDL